MPCKIPIELCKNASEKTINKLLEMAKVMKNRKRKKVKVTRTSKRISYNQSIKAKVQANKHPSEKRNVKCKM